MNALGKLALSLALCGLVAIAIVRHSDAAVYLLFVAALICVWNLPRSI